MDKDFSSSSTDEKNKKSRKAEKTHIKIEIKKN